MAHIDERPDKASNELSVKDLISGIAYWWRFLLRKWAYVVITALFFGVLGVTYAYFKKPLYVASLNFALEDDRASGGIGSALGLASQFGIDLGSGGGGGAFTGDNLLELMKSRTMVENALLQSLDINGKKQTLAELYISYNNIRDNWADKPELSNVQFLPNADRNKFTLKQDSLLGEFYKDLVKNNLSVDKADKKLSIITVKVTSLNEIFSKYFTETLTKTVSDFYVATKTKKSAQNVTVLQHQVDSVRAELNSAISGVASSIDYNPNPNPLLQTLRVPSQRRQIDVQANQAILTQLVTNLEISKLTLRRETPLIQIIDKPILPLEKERVGKAKALIVGGILGGFLAALVIIVTEIFRKITV